MTPPPITGKCFGQTSHA